MKYNTRNPLAFLLNRSNFSRLIDDSDDRHQTCRPEQYQQGCKFETTVSWELIIGMISPRLSNTAAPLVLSTQTGLVSGLTQGTHSTSMKVTYTWERP